MLPLHHIHGVMNILNTALFAGACCEFAAFDAAYILARLGSGDVPLGCGPRSSTLTGSFSAVSTLILATSLSFLRIVT